MDAGKTFSNSLKAIFIYNLKTSISEVVNQFEDENEFKTHLEENDVDIKKDLTEEDITAILDKWPEFFDNAKVELNGGDAKTILPKSSWLDDSTYEVTYDVTFNFDEQ